MDKILVIAEKPSAMREFKSIYQKNKDKISYEVDFTSFAGHTMRLKEPHEYKEEWKEWKAEYLPMIPPTFEYVPSKDKVDMVKNIMALIKKGNYDLIVNATDCGREGESIFFTFYDTNKINIPVKRLWYSDLTEKEIIRAFNNLRDYKTDKQLNNLKLSSLLRGRYDWLSGMNESRALSIKTNSSYSVGRVQTPTLYFPVQREFEIREYEELLKNNPDKLKSYNLCINLGDDLDLPILVDKEDEKRIVFETKEEGSKFLEKIGKNATVKDLEQKKIKTKADTLFNLPDLQKESNKLYGYTLSKTLEIAQSLYEKKIISYPRTESKFLTNNITDSFEGILKTISNSIPLLSDFGKQALLNVDKPKKDKKWVDDKKVTDHYAIVITEGEFNMSLLNKDEQNIINLIAKRFIAIFLEDMESVKSSELFEDENNNLFKSTNTVITNLGWKSLYKKDSNKTVKPTVLKKGDVLNIINKDLLEIMKACPLRYTDETLLKAMENAGKVIDDKEMSDVLKSVQGIGTPATSGGIVKNLVDKGLLVRGKKFYEPTEKAIKLIEDIHISPLRNGKEVLQISSPISTAKCENMLADIENGDMDENTFMKNIYSFIDKELELINQLDIRANPNKNNKAKEIGTCPNCGGTVFDTGKIYICSSYKKDDENSCKFAISHERNKAKIGLKDIKALMSGKNTDEKKFYSEGKKTYFTCSLTVEKNGKIGFLFTERKKTKISDCPKCGGAIYETDRFISCENQQSKKCDVSINKEFCKANFSVSESLDLINGKEVFKDNLVSNQGKSFSATLTWSNGKFGFKK